MSVLHAAAAVSASIKANGTNWQLTDWFRNKGSYVSIRKLTISLRVEAEQAEDIKVEIRKDFLHIFCPVSTKSVKDVRKSDKEL